MPEYPVELMQEFTGCLLRYDLTAHKVEVFGPDGRILLTVQPLPDNPGGFTLANPDHSIFIHNPAGVDFIGVHDTYEDNKALYG